MKSRNLLWYALIVGSSCISLLVLINFYYLYVGSRKTNIVVSDIEKNIGTISTAEKAEATFVLINRGDFPFKISDVQVGCHCTNVQWNEEFIAPGDSTLLFVQFSKQIPGYFEEVIEVYANIPDNPLVLFLKGNVKAE